jgi:hypothetical protein
MVEQPTQSGDGGSNPACPLQSLLVAPLGKQEATRLVVAHHYMHRRPPISFAFGLCDAAGAVKGVVTFGIPASHHMLIGANPADPASVIELNRLWVDDEFPRNTESWFVARTLALLPPRIVLSYADTAAGHMGYVYRAANFYYAGWTDMERKTPRFDYITPGMHTRDAFRKGERRFTKRVRRKPKVRYWIVTGNRRDRKRLEAECLWPKMDWKVNPPPSEHRQHKM